MFGMGAADGRIPIGAALGFRRAANVLLWEWVRRHRCGGGDCEYGLERQQGVARGVQQGEKEEMNSKLKRIQRHAQLL